VCVQVIGGGVVGLAIARRLAEREGGETLLIERHAGVGRESSSRNSEVGFCPEGRGVGWDER
jgi:L-2-hydroxyglutarate oxidase LhgO